MDPATEGFEAIHASYRPRIVRYLTRLVGPDAAEDLAQEAFWFAIRSPTLIVPAR